MTVNSICQMSLWENISLDNLKLSHSQLFLPDVEALMSWMWICGWLFTPARLCNGADNTAHTLMLQKIYHTHACLERRSRFSPHLKNSALIVNRPRE